MSGAGPLAMLREGIARAWGAVSGRRGDQDMAREIANHLELVEKELRRQGHSPEDAARLARVRAGNATQALETMREQRGIPALITYWLDTKLGLRMLRKNWGLTLIGGFTMVAAMTIGASIFNLAGVIRGASLPLDEGDRVVVIQPFDGGTRRSRSSSPEDFARWRTGLRSLENVGAFRTVQRNLIAGSAAPEPVAVAEMSAAGFQVARIAPLMGRFLLSEDELPGAPPVLVIGYDAWQGKFAASPKIVGQQVRLNGVFHTIAGVMPQKFAFPVNHQYWTALKRDAGATGLVVFGRLGPGASLENANAVAATMGLLEPKPATQSSRPLQARVVPYVIGIGLTPAPSAVIQVLLPLMLPLLLVPPCANIAILIYARTVARQGEFAARVALGASRGRIVGQILLEVFLLTAGAAGIALVLVSKLAVALRSSIGISGQPFWMDFGLSYMTIVFTAGLAVVAAMIAGGIPAMRATGRWKLAGLHSLKAGSEPRLGRVWTAVVVAQIALAIAVVPMVAQLAWSAMRPSVVGPGFEAAEFLTAQLMMDRQGASESAAARFNAVRAEMVRRLKAEPGVNAVTMSEAGPFEEPDVLIEVDGAQRSRQSALINQVDDAFFDTFRIPLLTGRPLEPGDSASARGAIVVNRTFASRILGDGNPLGRRVRVIGVDREPISASTPEYEIVGVVGDLFLESHLPTMYRPLAPTEAGEAGDRESGEVHQVRLELHAGPTIPPNLAGRMREIAAAIDPALSVDDLQTLDEIYRLLEMGDYRLGVVLTLLTLSGVLFSVAGIYTSMAFTVVQRRREIGLRSALGASPWRLIAGVFRQVLRPVAFGLPLGGLAALLLNHYLSPLLLEGERPLPWVLPAAETFIALVAVLALAGPARRALRIDPAEALRDS